MQHAFALTSPAFEHNGLIPSRYTCDGENISPPFAIENIPSGTSSLALLMDDPDIPEAVRQARGIEIFDHWVCYNLPPDTAYIPQDSVHEYEGLNSRAEKGYTGPCPPPQYEPKEHRYIFRLYALACMLDFPESPTLRAVETAARADALAHATLIGRYRRADT